MMIGDDVQTRLQGPMPRELKEEDRLAATVESIMMDAAIVPRGAWYKYPNGDVMENPSFNGLCMTDASQLRSYQHARPPKEKWNTNLLTRPDYNYSLDFLDSIDMDVPQGERSRRFRASFSNGGIKRDRGIKCARCRARHFFFVSAS